MSRWRAAIWLILAIILVGILQTVLDILRMVLVPSAPAILATVLGWVVGVGFVGWVWWEWTQSRIQRGS